MTKSRNKPKFIQLVKSIFQWENLERLKVILEIIAIPLAGYWAYTLFIETESELLLPRSYLTAEVKWSNKAEDHCEAEFKVDFKNLGKKKLEISRVRLKSAYLNDYNKLGQSENVKLIDLTTQIEQVLFTQDVKELRFDYFPEEQFSQGFLFLVKRSPGKKIFFEAGLWSKEDFENNTPDPTWNYYTWDWVCRDKPENIKDAD